MAEKQNLSMEKSLKTWIILGLLVLGTALLSGYLGEKNSPEPAKQQPDSSISAGRRTGAAGPGPPCRPAGRTGFSSKSIIPGSGEPGAARHNPGSGFRGRYSCTTIQPSGSTGG